MKHFKNTAALLLALLLTVSLGACAGNSGESTPVSSTEETAASVSPETTAPGETEIPVSRTEAPAATEERETATEEAAEPSSSRREPETEAPAEPHVPNEEDRALEGLWHGELDAAGLVEESLSLSGLDASMLPGLEKLSLSFYIDLELRDGEYRLSLNEEATRKALEAYLEGFRGSFIEFLYRAGEMENQTREETDAEMKDSYGMTVEEFVDSLFSQNMDSLDLDEAVEDLQGRWMAENGRIYFGGDETELLRRKISVEYCLEGDQLTISHPLGNALDLDSFGDAEISLVFRR